VRASVFLAVLAVSCGPGPVIDPMDAGALDASPRDAAGDACATCPPETVDFVLAMADPLAPARRLPGRVFLRSSREPEPQPGMRNVDYSNFVRMNEGRGVMAEETGPGVITRIWGTYGPPSAGTIDAIPMRLVIDGEEMLLDGMLDVPLGRLASGEVAGFPHPWVMDPSLASGGLVLSVPIHYQESARLEITTAAGSWAYYQIDGRTLPAGTVVPAFTVTPRPEHLAALDAARSLWVDHAHPGEDRVVDPMALAAGASIDVDVTGPAVITTLEVTSDPALRGDLHVLVTIDGETAADAPLGWLTGSMFPAGSYAAGLTASSATAATLFAPLPIRTSARVTITNMTGAPTRVGVRTRVLAGAIDDDVGHFRAECASATSHAETEVTETESTLEYANIVLGESVRGPGQYAGLTTFQTAPGAWWFALEPDHEVAIDGAYDILGTGTEDYFAGAFYFMNGPYTSVTSGASGWDRSTDPARTHLYRHHLVDTWPFEHDLRFELESYMPGTRFDSCIFTYLFSPSSGP
jgi:hypothetical protein